MVKPAKKVEKETTPVEYPGGVSEAQIKQWKGRWGEVHQVTVPLDDEGKNFGYGYFKKPNLETISAAGKFTETDPIKSGTIIFENCKLWISDEIKESDEAKLSCIGRVGQLFKVRAATIKKL